jgi:hypothetical protein
VGSSRRHTGRARDNQGHHRQEWGVHGKVQVGALILPIKGKVLGSGFWSGDVAKKGVVYTITFNLEVSAAADRQLIGTVTAAGLLPK